MEVLRLSLATKSKSFFFFFKRSLLLFFFQFSGVKEKFFLIYDEMGVEIFLFFFFGCRFFLYRDEDILGTLHDK